MVSLTSWPWSTHDYTRLYCTREEFALEFWCMRGGCSWPIVLAYVGCGRQKPVITFITSWHIHVLAYFDRIGGQRCSDLSFSCFPLSLLWRELWSETDQMGIMEGTLGLSLSRSIVKTCQHLFAGNVSLSLLWIWLRDIACSFRLFHGMPWVWLPLMVSNSLTFAHYVSSLDIIGSKTRRHAWQLNACCKCSSCMLPRLRRRSWWRLSRFPAANTIVAAARQVRVCQASWVLGIGNWGTIQFHEGLSWWSGYEWVI